MGRERERVGERMARNKKWNGGSRGKVSAKMDEIG